MKKRMLCAVLGVSMVLSMTACGSGAKEETTAAQTTAAATTAAETKAPETTAAEAKAETTAAESTEAATQDSDDEAWKQEPAYGQPIHYWLSDGCTSGPRVADMKGFFEEQGLTAEGVKGSSYTEALGTGVADVAVGHIATMLVPCTNGVDLTFVGGAHVGCKSLYVLGDSEYQSTEDLRGTNVSVPNGIGASDYNITARLLNRDGVNPLNDVKLMQVAVDACIPAMEKGEISAALLSDTYAYHMVEDGKLRKIRSLFDDDFKIEPCCIIAMNATFVKENPITSRKVATAVQNAHAWMRENPEEATQFLIDEGLNSEDFEMNLEINKLQSFGLEDDFTSDALKKIIDEYIELGLITSTDDSDAVFEKAWTPVR